MLKNRKKILLIFLAIFSVGVAFFVFFKGSDQESRPVVVENKGESGSQIEILAKNLEIPWEIDFLPGGRLIVTERPGRVLLIDTKSEERNIEEVAHIGEGGLLGLTLHPNFEENKYVYLYYTYQEGELFNKVVRYRFENDKLLEDITVIDGIPASQFHDGGRIDFGPDRKLYISTGDAQNPDSAQDLDSLSGKILRLNDDGSIPEDNPLENSPIYSYGHRNPQGLGWDDTGQLWITEHGADGNDEVNYVRPGINYGWPEIEGDEKGYMMSTPFIHSGSETWAPSGAVMYEGKLYFAGLAGRAIYSFDLETHEFEKYLEGEYGRLRTVNVGPDGKFYILTSNRDGRNKNPHREDDRIIKVDPSVF